MRVLEPFSYFADHTSALVGFGGASLGPDPRYILHTVYEDVAPGRAVFRLRFDNAIASRGEITFRVHSYRTGATGDLGLVASTRLRLDRGGSKAEPEPIEAAIPITAIEGVRYAVYGFFSEPSDLAASDVHVLLEELGLLYEDEGDDASRPISAFWSEAARNDRRQLVARAKPTLDRADSQDCTREQLAAIGVPRDQAIASWRERMMLGALERRDMLDAGATGLVRGAGSDYLSAALEARGCALDSQAERLDFVIACDLEYDLGGAAPRFDTVREIVGQLMHGGLAVILLAYDATSSALAGEYGAPNRNEIGRWALYMVGAGHFVAPIAFAPAGERATRSDGLTPFVLVVRHG